MTFTCIRILGTRDGRKHLSVFSGESNSGKSFNAVQVMRYLASSPNSKVTVKHVSVLLALFLGSLFDKGGRLALVSFFRGVRHALNLHAIDWRAFECVLAYTVLSDGQT